MYTMHDIQFLLIFLLIDKHPLTCISQDKNFAASINIKAIMYFFNYLYPLSISVIATDKVWFFLTLFHPIKD